ncbi:MAG: LysM peptidoglycan-binding domain-containing protein [Victivallaceae bacterium]|nr:LysM peptidoglycan-binding domain-containing protein [Victivallaceae bacterium]
MKTSLVILGGLLLLGSFGCAPRLAQTQLGDEELRWQKQIKKSYPAWKPPQTTPPAVTGNITTETNNETDIDISVETEAITVTDTEQMPDDTAAPATDTAPAAKTYTVQKGDTLSAISAKMYNTSHEVKRILEANRDIIKDQNKIQPGMKLVIPVL